MLKRIRRGFTLAEVLVTVAVVAVVAAVVIPSVVRQVTAGDPGRVSQDLKAIRTGIENFSLNLRPKYPLLISDLLIEPATSDNSLVHDGIETYGDLVTNWRGPYLEKSVTTVDSDIAVFTTGFSRGILNGLHLCDFNSPDFNTMSGFACGSDTDSPDRYVTVRVANVDPEQFELINILIDEGESPGSATSQNLGRLRLNASNTMFYLAYPYVTN